MLSYTARQALLTAHQCIQTDHWTLSPPTCIPFFPLHPHPSSRVTGNLLACHPFHAGHGAHSAFGNDSLTILECALLRWTTARPDICWAVIGTTTCISRSIQIWVTSNLLLSTNSGSRTNLTSAVPDRSRPRRALVGEETRKLTGRKWDWVMFPEGCSYFVIAWIAAWRREARSVRSVDY
jgi:hypothetical protein